MTENFDRMVVADPLAAFEKQGMLKLVSPSKVNLFLGIGALRKDGYHEVNTVMHTLNLHDVIHMDYFPESAGGLHIELSCYAREGLTSLNIEPEDNLVTKAIRLLAHKLGRDCDETFRIRAEKHIPFEAGLGGGSSNAAAALVGAAKFWGIEAPAKALSAKACAPEILETAAEIGSDVSFFLYGGCAHMSGAGERFEKLLAPMKSPVVLVKPEGGVSTAAAYQLFDKDPLLIPENLAHEVARMSCAQDVPLFNNLAAAAETLLPELTKIRLWLEEQAGTKGVLLCGSGATTIAFCENFDAACKISAAAQSQGWWARTTTLCSYGVLSTEPK
ncbi:MAG: 4-(cytidine 5'-diphospho)-2-C-methyl-D-erythritol kinase [Eggerthellaceae bacterium]|nr:4-(cytidine 5'-diphospho)-2-C-methyl-D-erythritol kinase [Eggerthellaceae bacterium]